MKNVGYANMTRETMISEGSGDAITLAIYKDGIHGYVSQKLRHGWLIRG